LHLERALREVKKARCKPPARIDASSPSRLSTGRLREGGLAKTQPPGPVRRIVIMNPFLWLVHTLIWAYIYVLIAAAVMSWLIAFNVVNSYNPTVRTVVDFLYRVTEPVLQPIRRILPNLGGIDISPVILIIGLMFIDQLIFWLYLTLFG
jgi:YggT family protein